MAEGCALVLRAPWLLTSLVCNFVECSDAGCFSGKRMRLSAAVAAVSDIPLGRKAAGLGWCQPNSRLSGLSCHTSRPIEASESTQNVKQYSAPQSTVHRDWFEAIRNRNGDVVAPHWPKQALRIAVDDRPKTTTVKCQYYSCLNTTTIPVKRVSEIEVQLVSDPRPQRS